MELKTAVTQTYSELIVTRIGHLYLDGPIAFVKTFANPIKRNGNPYTTAHLVSITQKKNGESSIIHSFITQYFHETELLDIYKRAAVVYNNQTLWYIKNFKKKEITACSKKFTPYELEHLKITMSSDTQAVIWSEQAKSLFVYDLAKNEQILKSETGPFNFVLHNPFQNILVGLNTVIKNNAQDYIEQTNIITNKKITDSTLDSVTYATAHKSLPLIAYGNNEQTNLWDLSTTEEIAFTPKTIGQSECTINTICFVGNNNLALALNRMDAEKITPTIIVISNRLGERIHHIIYKDAPYGVSHMIWVPKINTIFAWTGKRIYQLSIPKSSINSSNEHDEQQHTEQSHQHS